LRQQLDAVLPGQAVGRDLRVQLVAMFVGVRVGKNIVRHDGNIMPCMTIMTTMTTMTIGATMTTMAIMAIGMRPLLGHTPQLPR
jgi:hypothetical protein